ncbi:hypothetical protein [Streptomyces litchfieldiae]|uniref:Uncharacterized protein n=1 Tax=Streptomyces litchfieldiae TaxID=3075543 RepID=A0ABU2MK22_9ACTN|nr:hypothetical protein [Streptomyces sp. DSM 44938]MDT0341958.1 hypothetical protein [Streptomyces sp. DSM 44938]
MAERAAAERDLGSHLETHTIDGSITGLGCVAVGMVPALLAVVVALLAGPYGAAVQAMAVGLLVVLAITGPLVVIWAEGRRPDRSTRLHLFDRGLVVTGPGGTRACAWQDIRVTERVKTGGPPNGGWETVRWMTLSAPDGTELCALNTGSAVARSVRRALDGSYGS